MININGGLVADNEGKLSVFNRGFAYGDAVFETIRVVNKQIMFWEAHYFRLMSSMRIMRMEIPASFSPEFLEEEIKTLISENGLDDSAARVKLTVFRQEGGLYSPTTNDIDYVMTVKSLENPFFLLNEDDYEVELFKDHFINSGILSTLKTNNRAINILGSIFAKENDYQNCLLLNESKNVVEALNGNIFLVSGDVIKTPPLSDGCLKGVLRGQLLEIGKKLPEFTVKEESISPFELQKADEMFITNVIVGIQPVTRYRKKVYNNTVARKLLSRLNVLARLNK